MALMKCKMEKWNNQANKANKRLVLHVRIRCDSLSITKLCYFRPNEFDVRSVLHGQVSSAAVIYRYVFLEVLKGCRNLKIHYWLALKMYIHAQEFSALYLFFMLS